MTDEEAETGSPCAAGPEAPHGPTLNAAPLSALGVTAPEG